MVIKIKLQIRNIHQMKENFIYFMKRFQKLDDKGFKVSQIDIHIATWQFLAIFFDKFGKIRKYKFLHFQM